MTVLRSRFVAHCAVVRDPAEVRAVLASVRGDKKLASATHNIAAWRLGGEEGYEDDGEASAGRRLLVMLQHHGAQQVCVVCSRWYGGSDLGPQRFRVICSTARDLLLERGLVASRPPRPPQP